MKISMERLKKLYIEEGKTQKEIATALRIKPYEVRNAIVKYGLTRKDFKNIGIPKNHLKHWTKEQDEFLINNLGILSYEAIGSSKIIQKKATSVKFRVRDLKLGDPLLHGDFITKTFLARTLKTDIKVVAKWIEKFGLRAVKKVVALEREITSIKLDDFWKWAEQNKNLIQWNKFDEGDLGAEPNWTLKAREEYKKNTPKNNRKEWSNEEDTLLQSYYKLGKTYKQIGKLMGRTEHSVSRRLMDISVTRIQKFWSEEDKKNLEIFIQEGLTTKQIAKKLGRTIKSIEMGRTRFVNKPKQSLGL